MSRWVGWMVLACLVFAALIPLSRRRGRRQSPTSRAMNGHMALGLAVSALSFLHVVCAIPSLGDSVVIEGGMGALLPGVLGFFVIVAHTGIGLQLRAPTLPDRPRKRRLHRATAALIVAAVLVHVILLARRS